MSNRDVVSHIGVLLCLLDEFEKTWDPAFPRLFLPLACLVIAGCFWFTDKFRLPQTELRKWHLIHRYFKHFHDWREEEKAVGISEMYIHSRPADFRYSPYPEMPTKGPTQRKTDEFVHLSKGSLYTKWQEIWYEKKRNIRAVKWMVYGMSFIVGCQAILLVSGYILRLDSSVPIFYQKVVHQLEKKNNTVFCAKKLGEKDLLFEIGSRMFVPLLKETDFFKMKWIEVTILLLSVVFFILQLTRIGRHLIPPSLPRLMLLDLDVSPQKDYTFTARHRSSMLLYTTYLILLSLVFSVFIGYNYATIVLL